MGPPPDVRIVLGVFDPSSAEVLFKSSTNAQKVVEINAHQQAAFATPRFAADESARVREATVKQITPTVAQLALYNAKYPQIAKYAAHSDFFALTFKQAEITLAGDTTTVVLAD